MLKYLLEKEFKQILRNKFLSKLIIVMPIMTIVIFPFVTNQDVQDVKLAVVDQDHSPLSERLVQKASDSGYFRLADVSPTYEEAMRSIETGDADIVFQIPQDFERDLYRDGAAQVLIAANSVNGTRGALGAQYLASVVRNYNQEIRPLSGGANTSTVAEPSADVRIRYRFNPELEYKVFMVPGLIMMLLTILGCALTALNIVGEKEAGTIEQINVSPVSKRLFILAKLMRQADAQLDYRFHRPRLRNDLRMAGARCSARGELADDSALYARLRICNDRYRHGHLQLFRHDAAGDVRDVFLSGNHDADVGALHARGEYAPVDAACHCH